MSSLDPNSKITYDLKTEYEFPNVAADVIDRNHGVYYLQDQGDAQVKTQKCLVEKKYFLPSILGGTGGRGRMNQVLIKEDQYQDIGGGYATFVRHYARIPRPWSTFEEKSVLVYEQGGMMGINYDSFFGQNAFGNTGFNYKGATRRNVNYVCKATRYYVTKAFMDFYLAAKYSLQGEFTGQGTTQSTFKTVYALGVILIFEIKGKGFTGSFLRPNMLGLGGIDPVTGLDTTGDNVFQVDPNTGFDYPTRLYINAPLGTIQKDNNAECVVAPDRIRLWQQGIYEITRYTASINLERNDTERISVQVYWNFDETQSFTQDEIDTIKVDLFKGTNYYKDDTDPLTYYLYKDLTTEDEYVETQDIKIDVTYTDAEPNLFVVNTGSVNVLGGTVESIPSDDFSSDTISIKWNTEQPRVVLNFRISKVGGNQTI